MIKNINITCISCEIDKTTRKRIVNKIGGLDKYLPDRIAKNLIIDIKLIDKSKKRNHDTEKYEAEIIFNIPGKIINAKGLSYTIMSAIDAVMVKVQSQLREYKEMRVPHIGNRGILSHFKRSFRREL